MYSKILLCLGLGVLSLQPVHDASAQQPSQPLNPPLVTQLRLEGDLQFSSEVLNQFIQTRPNRRFLGIPGMALWVWLYRLGDRGCCFNDRFSQALMDSGEPPAYLDLELVESDEERLRLFYRQEGFRSAQIAARIDTLGDGDRVRVAFEITPGAPIYLRKVRYEGIDHLSSDQRSRLLNRSPLQPRYNANHPESEYDVQPQRYSESQLLVERTHLISFLRDEGYARLTRDSIRAVVTPVTSDSFDVLFRIRTGDRYRFGDINFAVVGPEEAPLQTDTLRADSTGQIVVQIANERRLEPETLGAALEFQPGDWFNQTQLLTSRRRLENIGIFTFTDFVPLWSDAFALNHNVFQLPYRVELRTRRRHQLRLESFMLQRTALLGNEASSEELGIGIGGAYRNTNLLGRGEVFQVRTAGSFAADLEGGLFNTAQAEMETSVVLPYLFWPFGRFSRSLNLYEARSRLAFSLLTARRESLLLTIRGQSSVHASLEMRHSPTLASLVSLVDFDLSDPDTLAGFSARFLTPIEDPVERERILEDYSRPQINNALRYTLRAADTNLFRRDRGYVREASLEIGGNLPYLLDRFVFSPDSVEGSLPGVPLFRRGGNSRLVYRQYVRMLADVRRYKPIGTRTIFAWKAVAALSHPIGQANVVPFDRRFYSGGSTSVRGWSLRGLGPGVIPQSGSEAFIQGGEIKLEASVESRNILLNNVLKADWMTVFFMDMGNVWYGPRNPGDARGRFRVDSFWRQFGIGGGLGLRIGWEYLIVRLDLGFKLHDPVDGLFADGRPELHFGIGQAF